jgi:hypothetical protein
MTRLGSRPKRNAMHDWWVELDDEVLACLKGKQPTAPSDVARRLGMSESGAVSLLCSLAKEGRVRICLVEIPPDPHAQALEAPLGGIGVSEGRR